MIIVLLRNNINIWLYVFIMNYKNIIFINLYHYGDIHIISKFIEDFASKVKNKVFFYLKIDSISVNIKNINVINNNIKIQKIAEENIFYLEDEENIYYNIWVAVLNNYKLINFSEYLKIKEHYNFFKNNIFSKHLVEMNNDENQIEGIGLIRNTLVYDKKHNIYINSDYNRYLYKGDYWVSRKTILDNDDEIIKICDTVLFKGKSHLKRVSGISVLTKQLFTNWDYKLSVLKEKIRVLFIKIHSLNGPNNILYQNNLKNSCAEDSDFDDGETFEIVPVKKRKIISEK